MPDRPTPEALDPRLFDHLGEIPADLLTDRLYTSVELIERLAREWAVALAHELGVAEALRAGGVTAESLAADLDTAPGFTQPLAWLLEELAEVGEVVATGEAPLAPGAAGWSGRRFRLPPGVGAIRSARVEAVRAAILEHDPANAPFVDLIDLAGTTWPRVAAGEVRGEAALLGASNLGLWMRYFSNDNPGYAVNNRFAAVAAANRLPADGRVLEVGAGAGSATMAFLEALEAEGRLSEVAHYRLTEPAAMLRRRAGREVAARWPEVSVEAGDLDIDRSWGEQGVEAGSFDLVAGVNVFHVARDLQFTLAEARRALAPEGWLVVGECLKPRPSHPVAAEMIFLLIGDFREVKTEPDLRPAAGFLTPELWVAQFEAAGFTDVELVPDVRVMREFYPRFSTGAIRGRR